MKQNEPTTKELGTNRFAQKFGSQLGQKLLGIDCPFLPSVNHIADSGLEAFRF